MNTKKGVVVSNLHELSPFIEFLQNNQILIMFLSMTGAIVFAMYVILKLIEKL